MNDSFLRACRGEPVERTPVWIMRQAGRYMAEYLAVRARHSFWEMCTIPEVTAEVTIQPVERLGVDAAILFSDILVPLADMGLKVDFRPGPEIENPVRSPRDIERLARIDGAGVMRHVADAIRLLRRELRERVPLIGFAGTPFTLAVYAVCGGGSKNQSEFRAMLFSDAASAHALLDRLADAVAASLRLQIEAGAQAVQIFDSWAGILGPRDYAEFAAPYAARVLASLEGLDVPRIYFAPGASSLLPSIADLPAEVIGVDWRIDLRAARERLGDRPAVQGNLDPGVLLGTSDAIRARTRLVLESAVGARGHIMNLGHGILPETPVENAITFVEAVHEGLPH